MLLVGSEELSMSKYLENDTIKIVGDASLLPSHRRSFAGIKGLVQEVGEYGDCHRYLIRMEGGKGTKWFREGQLGDLVDFEHRIEPPKPDTRSREEKLAASPHLDPIDTYTVKMGATHATIHMDYYEGLRKL